MSQTDGLPAPLFSLPAPAYPLSAIEKSVQDSIDAIRARPGGIPASKAFLAQTAMELARSIDKGNGKGRAVANESAQLVATLEILDPPEVAAAGLDTLPPELRKFMDAFSAAPTVSGPSAPPIRDTEGSN